MEIAQAHGAEAAAFAPCDVSDENAVQALVKQTLDRFGQIDILVNNAAFYAKLAPRHFNEWDVATWDKVMAVNTRGPFLMVKHVAPHMMARRSGKIINIASGAPYKGVASWSCEEKGKEDGPTGKFIKTENIDSQTIDTQASEPPYP